MSSYYQEAIGHVSGTGYRVQVSAGFKTGTKMYDGIQIKNVGNQYVDGVIRVFKVDDQQLYFKGQGVEVT